MRIKCLELSDEWDEAMHAGEAAYCHGLDPSNNPYPTSEEAESLHVAWQVGWRDSDNAIVEFDAGYHL